MYFFKFCLFFLFLLFLLFLGLVNLNEKNVKFLMYECKFFFCVCSWSCFKRILKVSRKVVEVGKKCKCENIEIVWKFKWMFIIKIIYLLECVCIIREFCCSCWLCEWFLFFWLLYLVLWLILWLYWFCSIMFWNWLKILFIFLIK